LKKIGQLFQVWMQFNPKIPKKLAEIAIPDKIHMVFSLSFVRTGCDLKTAQLQ